MAIIKTEELTKLYKDFMALDRLNLEIEEKDVFGFIGPNGAGKTTTIRILATLLRPSFGSAYINGMDVTKHPYEVKSVLGYMPDTFGVYDGMRLREYLDFFAAAYKIPQRRRKGIIDDVLALTDLTSKVDTYVSAFSRGMKQRCLLAKTLVHDPKVLLLDEPASGLDPRARIEIRELLKTLRDMGKTILISSHILSELGDMCNKIGIIEHGVLLRAGDYRKILEEVQQERELRLVVLEGGDAAAAILEEATGIQNISRSGNEFQMESKMAPAELADLHTKIVNAGAKVVFFGADQGTLEDVFMHVTRGGL